MGQPTDRHGGPKIARMTRAVMKSRVSVLTSISLEKLLRQLLLLAEFSISDDDSSPTEEHFPYQTQPVHIKTKKCKHFF